MGVLLAFILPDDKLASIFGGAGIDDRTAKEQALF